MAADNHSDLANGVESGFWGFVTAFLLREVMPWAIHTLGAFLSGAAVMIGLFFLKRWLQRSKWLKKKFPKLYE